MNEYTVHIYYTNFDCKVKRVRQFLREELVITSDKETAKAIAWQRVLGDNPYCHFVSWYARLKRRNA